MALNRQREKRAKVATKTLLSTTAISALYMTMMPKRKETTTAIVAVSATQAVPITTFTVTLVRPAILRDVLITSASRVRLRTSVPFANKIFSNPRRAH